MLVSCQGPSYWSLHPFLIHCDSWLLTVLGCTLLLRRFALKWWKLPNRGGWFPPPSLPCCRRPVVNNWKIKGYKSLFSFLQGEKMLPFILQSPCGISLRVNFSWTHCLAPSPALFCFLNCLTDFSWHHSPSRRILGPKILIANSASWERGLRQ